MEKEKKKYDYANTYAFRKGFEEGYNKANANHFIYDNPNAKFGIEPNEVLNLNNMEKKQTAVEWYANASHELIVKKNNGEITNTDFLIMHHNLFYEAQKMEKEQMKEAALDNVTTNEKLRKIFEIQFEDFYNETYGGTKN
jgi:hypothetical protein